MNQPAPQPQGKRPYIGVHFQCCNVYVRIYKNKEGSAYTGCCPRCGKQAKVQVGEGGTDDRFFTAR